MVSVNKGVFFFLFVNSFAIGNGIHTLVVDGLDNLVHLDVSQNSLPTLLNLEASRLRKLIAVRNRYTHFLSFFSRNDFHFSSITAFRNRKDEMKNRRGIQLEELVFYLACFTLHSFLL